MPAWRLPWPRGATVNHQYIHTRHNTRLSPRAAAWRDECIILVRQQGERVPAEGELVATIRFAPEQPTDWDGPVKLCQDSVCAGLDIDDKRIREGHVYRLPCRRPGWIEVRLEPAEGEPAESERRDS